MTVIKRPKRTIQYTKEELVQAMNMCNNDKNIMSIYLNIGTWSLRQQLKKYNLNVDGRIENNKKSIINIPLKEELEQYYHDNMLTLLEISKIYNVSNVTVSKWMKHYEIKTLTHSETIRTKVIPKIIKSNTEKYGYDHYFSTENAKEKIKNTFIEKYGVPYHPINNVSNAEIEVLQFFNSIYDGYKNTKIFGIELDGYNPNSNLAFEYCGIFWHNESHKGKLLHRKKYEICKNNGIRLITIFEDEWLTRKNQVKSFIKSAFNTNSIKKYARNLRFEILNGRDLRALEFIDNYHIQGKPNVKTSICHMVLFEYDDIVSCMSFSKHHRNLKEIVLSRYCVKSDYNIIGGSSKLFKNAINHFKCNIKTWSDNRWTEGLMYERLGFKLVKNLPIDYYYVGNKQRINKQKMTRKKIGASSTQTEYQRALELGFDRIWDCGKKTWIFEI